jgi:GH24 family phage-related lysozyme (muramidase)
MGKARIVALVLVVGASAAPKLVGLTASSEGVSTNPYHDTIGAATWTVCYGETNVPMRRYTLAECQDMLAASLVGYASTVRDSVPGYDELTPGQKVASVDYAYNRGLGAWMRGYQNGDPAGSVREAYARKDFPAACDLYLKWAVVSRKNKWVDCSKRSNGCYGIYTRRVKERAACLEGEK